VQVYVATFEEATGPVFELQMAPEGLETKPQVPVPVGAVALEGPVTVAVNTSLEPRICDVGETETATVGRRVAAGVVTVRIPVDTAM